MKVLAVLAVVFAVAQAQTFNTCSMAQTLYNDYGFAMDNLANWVCLIQYESSFNAAAVGAVNYDGTQDFGLFQINNKWWCQGDITSYNSCNIACTDLLNNVPASVQCAQLIYQQQGFKAWYGWLNNCQGTAPSVASCF